LRGILRHDRVATARVAERPVGDGEEAKRSAKRVLLVAEQPARALQLRTILTFAGFETYLCHTVSDAVLALKTVAPDAAVIDLGISVDGTSMTKEFALVVRATGPENVIIGVVIHNKDEELDEASMRHYGIDFTVEEPYGVNVFRRAIAFRAAA